MILESYNKDIYNLKIRLKLYNMLTIIQGESGTGKSFLFDVLQNESILGNLDAICINVKDIGKVDISNVIGQSKGKLIVIDNADMMLNGEQRVQISMDNNNQYIIFSHDTTGYKFADDSLARLVVDSNNVASLEYPLMGEI